MQFAHTAEATLSWICKYNMARPIITLDPKNPVELGYKYPEPSGKQGLLLMRGPRKDPHGNYPEPKLIDSPGPA